MATTVRRFPICRQPPCLFLFLLFCSRRHREQQSHTENIFVDARQPYSIAALTLIMVLIRHHHQHTTSAHPRAARPNKADRTKPTKPSRPMGFLGCVGVGAREMGWMFNARLGRMLRDWETMVPPPAACAPPADGLRWASLGSPLPDGLRRASPGPPLPRWALPGFAGFPRSKRYMTRFETDW